MNKHLAWLTERARFSYPVLIILGSLLVFALLTFSKAEPEARIKINKGPLVRVFEVTTRDDQVLVSGHGEVKAQQEARISAQVPGKVVWLDPRMKLGGFFRAGELMFRLEKSDYELKVRMAESAVAQAQRDLELASANSRIAEQEWKVMKELTGEKVSKKANSLVLQKPQLRSAEASLSAAEANLEQAKLNLKRTEILAPFDSFVTEKSFGLGQYIGLGESAAHLIGTSAVEMFVPVSLADYRWVGFGFSQNDGQPLNARVSVSVGDQEFSWDGKVSRLLGDVDPQGRMHRVVVTVDNPYFQPDKEMRKPRSVPLAVGMFAKVIVSSGSLKDSAKIPRDALRANNSLWLVRDDDTLDIRIVDVIRKGKNFVYVGKGLETGDRVVLTKVPGATPGMKLRPVVADSQTKKDL